MNKEEHVKALAEKFHKSKLFGTITTNDEKILATIAYEYFNPVEKGEDLVAGGKRNSLAEVIKTPEQAKELMDRIKELWKDGKEFGEWQVCPKCGGNGLLNPPYEVRGTNVVTGHCDVCNGAKVIARPLLNSVDVAQGSDTTEDASSTIADNPNTVPIQKYEELEAKYKEALRLMKYDSI